MRRAVAWALRGAIRGLYQVELAWAWLRLAAWVAAMLPRWAAESRALGALQALWSLGARVRLQGRLRWVATLEREPVGPGGA